MYNPENQYRCTIIRGKSQSDMEDLLPLYATVVHTLCPCEESAFRASSRKMLSKALFKTEAYDLLSDGNKKTINNHITEIAGTLLGLYYSQEIASMTIIKESEACRFLVKHNDYPMFFKNLCLNFQFPNGAKKMQSVKEDISRKLNIRPFCFVVALLYHAQCQKESLLLTKQEIGYYVLNSLDALKGLVSPAEVYDKIIADRANKVKRDKLFGSHDWQHIKEQFNLLELTNIIETNATYLWLNNKESETIKLYLRESLEIEFDCYKYALATPADCRTFINDWKEFYGRFNNSLLDIKETSDMQDVFVIDKDKQKAQGGATMTTTDVGDKGEALVFRLEQNRVRKYKERLVNKVLLLGKTKGLGYDISSIEADENPKRPEFARYIEVKSTTRITVPKFDKQWSDSLNITAKEWIAAEQYGEFYNIYRVYFTKSKTIVVRINNPYKQAQEGIIEVYPVSFQMNFGANVIELRYDE